MTRILACAFGGMNLLVTLLERLRARMPGKYEIAYLTYNEYSQLVYRQLKVRYIHTPPGEAATYFSPQELEEATCFTRELQRISTGNGSATSLHRAANHYGAALDRIIAEEPFDHVLLFNGRMNLFITVLDLVADRHKLPKLVFEQGLFRPGYVTIDGRGVNFRNSIRSLEELLSPEPFAYQQSEFYRDLTSLLPIGRDEIIDYKRRVSKVALLMAYARMKVMSRNRFYLRDAEGRDLLEAGLFRSGRPVPRTHLLDEVLAPGRYRHVILVPFQVETDTQVLLHSPRIRTMRQLVEVVGDALRTYNAGRTDKACVLFKIHPMHNLHGQVSHEDAFLINESTVPEILRRRCDLVITLNSTAGIEAIEAGCLVITLGDAFYNMAGVISAACTDLTILPDLIDRALNSQTVDPGLQRQFIESLKNKYQVRLHPES